MDVLKSLKFVRDVNNVMVLNIRQSMGLGKIGRINHMKIEII